MLQALGTILILATAAATIVTIVTTQFERRGTQVAAGAVAGGWIGILAALTMAGVFASPRGLLPFFVAFLAPFLVAAVPFVTVRNIRERLLAVPRRLLLGLNIFRVNGFLFILLAYTGQLSGPFPFFAGIGDVIVGLVAISLALREPRLARSDARLAVWNGLGIVDLVTAVALALISGNGSPLQLIHAGVGSAAIAQFPWSLIPLFLVPYYLMGHVIMFIQMRANVRRLEYAVA